MSDKDKLDEIKYLIDYWGYEHPEDTLYEICRVLNNEKRVVTEMLNIKETRGGTRIVLIPKRSINRGHVTEVELEDLSLVADYETGSVSIVELEGTPKQSFAPFDLFACEDKSVLFYGVYTDGLLTEVLRRPSMKEEDHREKQRELREKWSNARIIVDDNGRKGIYSEAEIEELGL